MNKTITYLLSILLLFATSCELFAQSESTDVVLLSTNLKKGETLYLIIRADELDVEGAKGEFTSMSISEYEIEREGEPLKIKGKNISMLDCSNNQVTALDASAAPSLMSLVCNSNVIRCSHSSYLRAIS